MVVVVVVGGVGREGGREGGIDNRRVWPSFINEVEWDPPGDEGGERAKRREGGREGGE